MITHAIIMSFLSMVGLVFGKCEDISPIKANGTIDLAVRGMLKSANVMICAILKNEQLYVDEWLEYHRFLGFDRVQLYDNADNASVYIAGLPEKYGAFVNVTHFPGLGKQIPACRDCMLRNEGRNTWAAFIDIDEFVVLRKHANIKAFLQDLAPNGGSVVLGWSLFGSNHTMKRTPEPVLVRFTLTSEVPGVHTKTIAYLKHAQEPNVHNTLMLPGHPTVDQYGRAVDHKSPFLCNNARDIAYINHYYTKSFEEFQLKRQRGWASNYKKNRLVSGPGQDAYDRILQDYNNHNKHTNAVQDTFARDFYLKHYLGKAFNGAAKA